MKFVIDPYKIAEIDLRFYLQKKNPVYLNIPEFLCEIINKLVVRPKTN